MLRLMKLIDILDATPIPVGYRLAFLTNFWREPLLRRMEAEFGLIRPELTVLMCLNFEKNLNARDICEITEQPSNTVSRAVASLCEKGHITRELDEHDNRRRVLNITQSGKDLLDGIMALFIEAERELLQFLSADEVAQLTGLLDKLARAVPEWSRARVFQPSRSGPAA